MDEVEGGHPAALVRENPLPANRAAGYVKMISEPIHYAHRHGMLRRNLKPSNVLLDHADQPHFSDFGLAKRMTKESFLTVTGDVTRPLVCEHKSLIQVSSSDSQLAMNITSLTGP